MTDEDAGVDTCDRARWPRRAVLAGLAGAGLAATAGVADRIAPPGAAPPERDLADVRRTAERPADAAGFASRDESYARSAGPIERASAVRQPAPAPAPAPTPGPEFPTAAAAAAATEVTVATILDPADPVVHLLRRTTFGPTPELVAMVHAVGIDAWLESQLAPGTIPDPEADAIWAAFPLASADPPTIRASVERARWDAMNDHSTATMARQVWSNRQLFEVMVDFWANHLNVPTPGPGGWDVGPAYQNDVIRRHALGTFSDMLVDAVRHPALLRYLTAAQSTKESVNENLGRELLELHTVGVASGYTEDDVRNSAYILTGRTVLGRDAGDDESTFRYDPDKHWVGPVTVLDFHHDNSTA
ncbi:MAG: DUF1800 family protein, partial [Acidimicrobiales bacterium]|nr:DUF1800 family protein [Acidimicrobiales bacterium]